MSMKKLAVLSALHNYGGLNNTEMNHTPGSPPAPVHGVNVMLGGAMVSGIILVVFIFCYCCHKTQRKSQTHLPSHWRISGGLSMEIYTVEAESCFGSEEFSDTHSRPPPPSQGPPPAYDTVVPIQSGSYEKQNNEADLPTYETAIQLQPLGNLLPLKR